MIENYRGFTYEIFEDESKYQPRAMYDDIMQLIDDRNDALLKTNEFRELVKELSDRNKALQGEKRKLEKELLQALRRGGTA